MEKRTRESIKRVLLLLMDTKKSTKDTNGCVNKPMALTMTLTVASLEGRKVEDRNKEDDSDSNSLLPLRKGGISRKSDKTYRKRKVQWNDRIGNKLVEVLEYEPR
ncbi:hypothetical protein JHK82_028602 [Glycine max]|nr:hypothetical protein JHK85_029269 [Glycine max]KAG5004585.1 hypothetical protein JHK86_028724 [Glycine max]KAG5127767.1 hypothetical protein JHK82_028602 [Glycine max]